MHYTVLSDPNVKGRYITVERYIHSNYDSFYFIDFQLFIEHNYSAPICFSAPICQKSSRQPIWHTKTG